MLGKQTINTLQTGLGAVLLRDAVLIVLAARAIIHIGKHLAQDYEAVALPRTVKGFLNMFLLNKVLR